MMAIFGVVATLMALFTVAAIVVPLLGRYGAEAAIERGEANLQILRDQLAELDSDLRIGVLSGDQYESARAEVERRVLDESQLGDGTLEGASTIASKWRMPAVVGLVVPVFATLLYLYLGNVDGLVIEARMQRDTDTVITPEHMQSMTRLLAQHLEEDPENVEGWAMLGRSYRALQQFPESARAWERAAALDPGNADILADYAEALGLASQGKFEGEATRLLARALDVDPTHSKALALSGSAAFVNGDYQGAIEYWQRLLPLSGDDIELSAALRTGITEAQSRINQNAGTNTITKTITNTITNTGTVAKADSDKIRPSGSIDGVVAMSPKMSGSVRPGDTVFIFVRAAEGPRMPLAVARVTVDALPSNFHMDDSMAMVPEMKISDFRQVVIGARVSRTGKATRSSGDLEGFSVPVEPGSNGIRVVIDQRVQ